MAVDLVLAWWQAATCFNQIMLPPYDSLETMAAKLELAINETGGFGLK